ncbi:hypothetical protein KBC03_03755 [Patescibacteria group bacterium]|nr:hypothetical protein [Patescibacteria group bacterium]
MNVVEDEFSVFEIGVDVGRESFSLCKKRVPEVRAQDVDKDAERDDGEDTEGCEHGHGQYNSMIVSSTIRKRHDFAMSFNCNLKLKIQ